MSWKIIADPSTEPNTGTRHILKPVVKTKNKFSNPLNALD